MRALVRGAFAASMLLATARACTDDAHSQPSPQATASQTAVRQEAPRAVTSATATTDASAQAGEPGRGPRAGG